MDAEGRIVVKRKVRLKEAEIPDTVYTEPDIESKSIVNCVYLQNIKSSTIQSYFDPESRFERSNCCVMCKFFLAFLVVALALSGKEFVVVCVIQE